MDLAAPPLKSKIASSHPVLHLVSLARSILIQRFKTAGKKSFTVYKGEGGDVAIFEIWEGSVCMVRVNVPNAVHGDVINDGLFSGGVSWSNDESKIAYVADVRHANPSF